MPIYEYRCSACGHELEALQKLSDTPLTVCPSCGKSELRKQVSAAGFQLKGSGWYVTDFRNNGAKAGKDKAGKDAAKANGGTDAAGDGAKPESKSTETATTTSATESKTSTPPASKSET